MENTVADLKPFRAGKRKIAVDEEKIYEFELVTRYEASRPRDKKTDTPLGSGWPPSFSYPNHGTAYNEAKKKFENWRFIEGQPSIFVSEQPELENYEKEEIHEMLGQAENQLEFKDGRLMVRGDNSGQLRLQALFAQDYFEQNEHPRRKNMPKAHMFRLNNPDAILEKSLTQKDLAFSTMQQARNCTITEMLAVSLIMGIDITDTSNAGLNRIKNAFLQKAEYDPRNPKGLEFFMQVINSPDTKAKFIFSQGLSKGIISADQIPGKLTWAKPQTAILDLTGVKAPADELTALVIDRDVKAIEVMKEIEVQLENSK
jgi:hypothetical protein